MQPANSRVSDACDGDYVLKILCSRRREKVSCKQGVSSPNLIRRNVRHIWKYTRALDEWL